MTTSPDIVVTDRDKERLQYVVEARVGGRGPVADVVDFLDQELARARIVPSEAVEPTVATMRSRVEFEDLASGQRRCVTIVYPEQANAEEGRISVLTPVAVALLGLSEGQEIAWQLSDNRPRQVKLVKIHFQPEAAGQFDL